jgi:hypothetical protein
MKISTLKMNSHAEKRMDLLDGIVDFTGFQHESGKVFDGQIEKGRINKCIKKRKTSPYLFQKFHYI